MKFHSLSFKIPFMVSVILIISFILLVTIATSLFSKYLTNMEVKVLGTALNSYSDMLNLYFEEKKLVMDIYAQNYNIINFIKNPTPDNRILAENSLKTFNEEIKYTESFYDYSLVDFDANIFLDSVGGSLLNINYGKNSDDWKNFANTGYDFLGRDYVQPLYYNSSNIIYVIWKGIKDENGNVIGVLSSSINWNKFLNNYIVNAKVGDIGSLMIIDKNKNIIASTDTNRLYIYESNIVHGSGGSAYERKSSTIKPKENAFFQHILNTKTGIYNYENDNGEKLIVSYKPINNTSWYLLASVTKKAISQYTNRLSLISYLIAFVIVIITILIFIIYSNVMLSPLNVLVEEASRMADGYILLGTIDHKLIRKDEVGDLVASFSKMKHSIREMLDVAEISIKETKDNVQQMSSGSTTLLSRTEQSVADIASVASSTEEITSNIQHTVDNSARINSMMSEARDIVENAYASIVETADASKLVSEVSKKISNITKAIEDIAMQTGLLALNASVEAARAGDQGKGFAVVAAEVRNLAQTSSSSIKSIIDLINESNEKIKKSEQSAIESKKLFEEIKDKIEQTSIIISEFSSSLKEEESGIKKINENMSNIERTTKDNGEFIDSLNSLSSSLEHNTASIEEAMSFFKFNK